VIGRLENLIVEKFSLKYFVVVSILTRFFGIAILPNNSTSFAPDEAGYALLAKLVSTGDDFSISSNPGAGLYNTSKTYILPAAGLIKLGFDELVSVRITSTLFGVLSVYFFIRTIFLILGVKDLQEITERRSRRVVLVSILAFNFWPSIFLWSILGLRETVSIASMLTAVFFLLKIRELASHGNSVGGLVLYCFLALVVISLSFGARRQTAMVFVVLFCVPFALLSFRKGMVLLISISTLGGIAGVVWSTTPNNSVKLEKVWQLSSQELTYEVLPRAALPFDKTPSAGEPCELTGLVFVPGTGLLECVEVLKSNKKLTSTEVFVQVPVPTLQSIGGSQIQRSLGAETAIPVDDCSYSSTKTLDLVYCIARHLPFRLFSTLFRPLPILDSGSLSNNLASIENIMWLSIFMLFLLSIRNFKKGHPHRFLIVPASLFVMGLSNLFAIFSGNLGTAFRHKSVILWALLLVVSLASHPYRQIPKEQKEES